MLRKILLIKDIYTIFTCFIIFIFFFYSSYQYLYIYDGHHHGYIFSNALDLLNGKKPYKEIFIQYGLLSTFINALILKLFGQYLFILNFFNIIFYNLSVFLIFLTIRHNVNALYGFLATIIILFNHPIPWLPWPNYLSFLFITLGVYLLSFNKGKNFIIAGICFSLSALSRQEYIISSILTIFLSILFFYKNKNNGNKLFHLFIKFFIPGFIFPFLIFYLYLIFAGLTSSWVYYLNLPLLYLSHANYTVYVEIYNFIVFFLTKSFFNFLEKPQYILISLILISNFFIFFRFLKINNFHIFFISSLSLTLSSVAINLELFRLYTSVLIGIIPFLFFISTLNDKFYRRILLFCLLFFAFFSFIFFPSGNNNNLNPHSNNRHTTNISEFKFQRWKQNEIIPLEFINNIYSKLTKNCKIKYFDNLSFDTNFIIMSKVNRVKLFPYVSSHKDLLITSSFDYNFVKKINFEILAQNIIFTVSDNNLTFKEGNIIITENYTFQKINLNNNNEKPRYLKFYYPKKCIN